MSKLTNRRAVLKSGGVIASLGLAGCTGGPGGQESPTGADPETGTPDEGGSTGGTTTPETADQVNIYGIPPGEGSAFVEGFVENTGIDLNITQLLGGQATSRFLRENQAGEHIADVIWGNPGSWRPFAEQELIADPQVDNIDNLLTDDFSSLMSTVFGSDEFAQQVVPQMYQISCFTYNTEEVSDPPTEYEDFLADRFEGRIIAASFNLIAIYNALIEQEGREYADEFMSDFHDQNPTYVAKAPGAVVQDIAEGRGAVTMFPYASHTTMQKQEGASVDFNFGSFLWRFNSAAIVTSTAPHPNAAREFAEYAASQEGQENLSQVDAGVGVFHPDVPHGNQSENVGSRVQDKPQVPVSLSTLKRASLTEQLQELGLPV